MHHKRRNTVLAALLIALLLALLWWLQPAGSQLVASTPEPPSSKNGERLTTSASPRPEVQPPPVTAPSEPPLVEEEDPLAEPPPGIPDGRARCALIPPLPTAAGHLVVGDAQEIPYNGRLVSVRDGVATLPWVEGEGQGTLAIEGYAPVAIRWSGGERGTAARCAPDPVRLVPAAAHILGHVRNAEGEPEGKVFVEGCGNQARTDADGGYALTVVPGPCVINAFRRDGLLVAAAEAAQVHPTAGSDLVVDFELPELPRAGLGVQIRTTERGVEVLGVLEGTAAQDAGLEEGDVVVEIGGISTLDIDLKEFVELAVGPVGTEVDVVVESMEGVRERMVLDRRELTDG